MDKSLVTNQHQSFSVDSTTFTCVDYCIVPFRSAQRHWCKRILTVCYSSKLFVYTEAFKEACTSYLVYTYTYVLTCHAQIYIPLRIHVYIHVDMNNLNVSRCHVVSLGIEWTEAGPACYGNQGRASWGYHTSTSCFWNLHQGPVAPKPASVISVH